MEQFLPLISRCALFQGLSRAELGRALDCLAAVKKEYPRGAFLLRAGDQTGQMGLMLWGSALLVREDLWGRRNIIDKVLPGDVFAEAFAASGAALNLSAVAGEDCGVLLLDVGQVLTACPSACPAHHKIIQNLTAVLARKLLLLQDKITHMGRHTTREKLLSYLSAQAARQGRLTFDIPFDRQQLADYLCVDRAAMSAELSKLQRDGLLRCRRNHFTLIADPTEELL